MAQRPIPPSRRPERHHVVPPESVQTLRNAVGFQVALHRYGEAGDDHDIATVVAESADNATSRDRPDDGIESVPIETPTGVSGEMECIDPEGLFSLLIQAEWSPLSPAKIELFRRTVRESLPIYLADPECGKRHPLAKILPPVPRPSIRADVPPDHFAPGSGPLDFLSRLQKAVGYLVEVALCNGRPRAEIAAGLEDAARSLLADRVAKADAVGRLFRPGDIDVPELDDEHFVTDGIHNSAAVLAMVAQEDWVPLDRFSADEFVRVVVEAADAFLADPLSGHRGILVPAN